MKESYEFNGCSKLSADTNRAMRFCAFSNKKLFQELTESFKDKPFLLKFIIETSNGDYFIQGRHHQFLFQLLQDVGQNL